MADAFADRAIKARDILKKRLRDSAEVDDDHLFWGFDCHENGHGVLITGGDRGPARTACANTLKPVQEMVRRLRRFNRFGFSGQIAG